MDNMDTDIRQEESAELEQMDTAVEDGFEALEHLVNYNDLIAANPKPHMAMETYQMLEVGLESIRQRLGLIKSAEETIATENLAGEVVDKQIVLESISETAVKIWKKLVEIIGRIRDAIVKFFGRIKEAVFGVKKKADHVGSKIIPKENEGKVIEAANDAEGSKLDPNSYTTLLSEGKKDLTAAEVRQRLQEYVKLNNLFIEYSEKVLESFPSDLKDAKAVDEAYSAFLPKLKMIATHFKRASHDGHEIYTYKGKLATILASVDKDGDTRIHTFRFVFEAPEPREGPAKGSIHICTNPDKDDICTSVKKIMDSNSVIAALATAVTNCVTEIEKASKAEADNRALISMVRIYQGLAQNLHKATVINERVCFQALRYAELGFDSYAAAA